MRAVFLGAFAALSLLSGWAMLGKPRSAPPGRVVLTWVTDEAPSRREQMEQFRRFARARGRPDVDIRLDPGNSGMDKIVVQSVGGIGPDLFDMYQSDQLHAYARSGIVTDITHQAAARGFGLDRFWPALARAASVEGRQYSVPTNGSPSALFYNKDLFDRYGVPYPEGDWTWDEFVETAKKLTRRNAGGRGYASFGVMGYSLPEAIWQAGGQYFSEDGTRCVLDSPEAIAGARFYHDLQHRHHAMPTAAEESAMSSTGGWGTGALNYFMGGHIGMIVSGRFAVLNWRRVPRLRVGVAPLPRGRVRANRLFWRSTAINANSPHREEALLFHEFLASEEYGRGINTSGDGISAVPEYTEREEYRRDPAHPDETDNALWVEQMRTARDLDISPYVNPFAVSRIVNLHTELLRAGSETPENAMRNAAREVNALIRKNIANDPLIRERYEEATARPRETAGPGGVRTP